MSKYSNELISNIAEEKQNMFRTIKEKSSEGIIIYGAGFQGKWAVDYLQNSGANIKYIVDGNPGKWGSFMKGIEIIGPNDERINEYPRMLIAISYFVKDIEKKFAERNIAILPFNVYYTLEHLEDYSYARDTFFHDEKSKETYNAILYAILTGDKTSCEEVMVLPQYFALNEFCGAIGNEVFVDVGAYVGQTLEEFVRIHEGMFKHIYAFEPGTKQFEVMSNRVNWLCDMWGIDENKITLVNAGLTDKTGKMQNTLIDVIAPNNSLIETGNDVDVYSLDEFLKEENATFIKINAEGMELKVIEGAKNLIADYAPKLAIAVYHHPEDLFVIVNRIYEINPKYKFKLRLHMPEQAHYILYCY